ncbi:MAG: DUF2961 domain-containing protein, partial [Mucilaginibacter sp.]
MKRKKILIHKLLISLLIPLCFSNFSYAQSAVNLRSLLTEMVNYDEMARWPSIAYIEKQASSYDRASIAPGKPGWFANADASQYISTELVNGRKENVMLDANGPGAVVRFWITTFKRHGNLRIYLDNNYKPVLTIPAYDLMRSGLDAGPALLAPHSSYEPNEKGGSTLYLPIPFAKHCKITWEDFDTDKQPRYYQINYRLYTKGTMVKTFEPKQLKDCKLLLNEINHKLLHPDTTIVGQQQSIRQIMYARDSMSLVLPSGQRAARLMRIKLNNASIDSLMISLQFDGKQTVYCPLSDFAGSGKGGKPLQNWYRTVTKEGLIYLRWVMPYRYSASITLSNLASSTASPSLSVTTKAWKWDHKSLYFHASWRKGDSIPIHTNEKENPIEWTFLNTRGRGVFIGDTYAVDNMTHGWYGEGDQKFWVDKDSFPSEFGTGTEDYYNTSWAPVALYQTPFANAPRADNADSYGQNTFTRTRNLDRIPFRNNIKYSIEMLSWRNGTIKASAVTYWYGDANAVASIKDNETRYAGFMWHGRKAEPELVNGVIGEGVRTDGYSSFLSLKTRNLTSPRVQLKGYFALESYPNDTAGFITIYGNNRNNWVSACINKFGIAYLCVSENGKYRWIPSQLKLEKFKWIHVALSLKDSAAWLSIDGRRIQSTKINAQSFAAIDSIEVGKDGRTKRIAVFPLNYINGIIDQPQLTTQPDQKVDVAEIIKFNKLVPHLAIPRSRFEGDVSRPLYHLLPAANWTNETHGLIYYNGLYHIFNQKNASNLLLDQINWGHYTSSDLIHWVEHRPILTPEPGYDQNGIWSGCVVVDNSDVPNIFYSSSGPVSFDVCRALPKNKTLLTWYKPAGNPVINSSPAQYSRKDFHDPYVWKDGKKWYMIVGFGLPDSNNERGAVLLYRSEDLKKWRYLHPLYTGNPSVDNSGVFWEMPVFYKVGDKYILLVNKVPHKGVPARALYWIGKFEDEKFIPDDVRPKNLEVINRLLSPSVTRDANGDIVAIAIIPDETSPRATYNVGWTHLYSIPRVWTLKKDKICQQPYPGLKVLRDAPSVIPETKLSSGDTVMLSVGKHQVEINVDLVPDTTGTFGFLVGKGAAGTEYSK